LRAVALAGDALPRRATARPIVANRLVATLLLDMMLPFR
jgi:hypothetical protein